MPPADSASRAGGMPKASGDPSSRTFARKIIYDPHPTCFCPAWIARDPFHWDPIHHPCDSLLADFEEGGLPSSNFPFGSISAVGHCFAVLLGVCTVAKSKTRQIKQYTEAEITATAKPDHQAICHSKIICRPGNTKR